MTDYFHKIFRARPQDQSIHYSKMLSFLKHIELTKWILISIKKTLQIFEIFRMQWHGCKCVLSCITNFPYFSFEDILFSSAKTLSSSLSIFSVNISLNKNFEKPLLKTHFWRSRGVPGKLIRDIPRTFPGRPMEDL